MARITGSPFMISGKIGDKVYRVRDGKMYVSALPKKIKIPDDEGSIKRRDRFGFTMKLVSAVYKINPLVSLWRHVFKKDKVISRRMFKEIYACTGLVPQITPESFFNFEINAADTSTGNFELTVIIPSPHPIEPFYEPLLLGTMMLYYTDPECQGKNKNIFIPLTSNYVPVTFDEEFNLNFNLTPLQLSEFNSYPLRKIYVSLLTIGRNSEPVKSSSTVEVLI